MKKNRKKTDTWRNKIKGLLVAILKQCKQSPIPVGHEGYLKINGLMVTLYRIK